MNLMQRRQFLQGGTHLTANVDLMDREKVCAAEIWQECFGSDIKYMGKRDSMEINNILSCISGWKRNKSSLRYGFYGTQRGFERVSTKR